MLKVCAFLCADFGEEVFFVMYGKMHSACLYGIEGVIIGVEVDLANGLPQTNIM